MGGVDHALVNFHLGEGVVDFAGGKLDTEGHEGVPEGIGINLAVNLKLGGNSLIITNYFGPGFKNHRNRSSFHKFTSSKL